MGENRRLFEMLIPKRPVSHQSKNRENLQAWKQYVAELAREGWHPSLPLQEIQVRVTLVYLCNDSPGDVDNIIKPIQDALVGVVLVDDSMVADVDSHRRYLSDGIDLINLPALLVEGVTSGDECVYVAVAYSGRLEEYV